MSKMSNANMSFKDGMIPKNLLYQKNISTRGIAAEALDTHLEPKESKEPKRSGFSHFIPPEKYAKLARPGENLRFDLYKNKSNNYQLPVIDGNHGHHHSVTSPTDKANTILQQDKDKSTKSNFRDQNDNDSNYQNDPVVARYENDKENFVNKMEYLAYLSKKAAADPSNVGNIK